MGEAGDVVKAVGAWVVGFEKPVGGDDLVGFAIRGLQTLGFWPDCQQLISQQYYMYLISEEADIPFMLTGALA